MSLPEEPILQPEGDGHGWRFESADLDTKKLVEYFADTTFEDEKEVVSVLTKEYDLDRRENTAEMKMYMIREYNLEEVAEGRFTGDPLSHVEPVEITETEVRTVNDGAFILKIYRVYNRNNKYRFEYVLDPFEPKAN